MVRAPFCAPDLPGGGRGSLVFHPSAPKSPSAASPSTARSEQASFVQTCSESVYGELPKDWQRNSIVVGPIAFYALRGEAAEPPQYFAHHLGGWRATKTTAVVSEGKSVTVSVPPSEGGHLALLYGLHSVQWGLHRGWRPLCFSGHHSSRGADAACDDPIRRRDDVSSTGH